MRILIFACVYGRPHITRIFASGIRRLQETFNIEPLTVVSTDEDYDLCLELGLNPFMAHNSPLGRKHNEGMAAALKKKWNRLIISGSDDLYSKQGIELLLNTDRSHCGFTKMYAVNTECDQTLYFEYKKNTRIIGAGRMLTREAVETTSNRCTFFPRVALNRRRNTNSEHVFSIAAATHLERRGFGKKTGLITGLWEDGLERNLDNSSDINLSLCGFPPYCVEDEKVHIIDLKSQVNLNYWSALKLQEDHIQYEVKGWSWFLGKEEKEHLRKLNPLIEL